MGDPLSVAASIIAVLQATDFVLTNCYVYVGRVKNAAGDLAKILQEAGMLKGILTNLGNLAKNEPNNPRLELLIAPGGPIPVCKKALDDLDAKLKSSVAKFSMTKKLLWPFESKKLDEILECIRKQFPNLELALNTDNAFVSREIRDSVKQLHATLESAQFNEKREKILDWLKPNDPKQKHLSSREAHEKGSNQWLLDHSEFTKWTQTPRMNIWLHGIPGCGKTILCSSVIENVHSLCQSEPGRRMAYYYFDFSDPSNQKVSFLLRSMIFQLCVEMGSLPKTMSNLYDECDRGRSQASEEQLASALFEILDSEILTHLIIDGLDECLSESERPKFITLILDKVHGKEGNFGFLFTSRIESDIEEGMKRLQKQAGLSIIPIETEKVDSDVRLHVRSFIFNSKKISNWSESVRKEIEDELVRGSQGMFRWIELQLRSIGKCALPSTARRQLKHLPPDLYTSYDRILESVSDENTLAVRSALMFLAYSKRPVLVHELAEAVMVNVDDQLFDPEERTTDPMSIILELCSSLVTIGSASDDDFQWLEGWKNSGFRHLTERTWTKRVFNPQIVKFSHYSVKEYIVSGRQRHTTLHSFHFTEIEAHHFISEALVFYLVAIGLTESANLPWYAKNSDFLRLYAAEYWPQHIRNVPEDQRRESLVELVHTLFNTKNPGPWMLWLKLYNQDFKKYGRGFMHHGAACRQLSDFPPPVYIASLLGETELCQWLVDSGSCLEDPSGHCELGDPLQAAALGNHLGIAKILLEEGAQVNTDRGYFGDPLQAAAFAGGLELVKLLLEKEAIVNTEHGEYGNALIAASHNGHVNIAKLLIEKGANTELLSRKHGKAIARAAASGKTELIKLLLLKGNDINDTNGSNGSALYNAASSGDLQVVRMLVKAGADINLKSGELFTALQAACNQGHSDVVKFLLDNGADVNIFGGQLDSALQASINNGDIEIMELLLARGADMDHQGGLYKYPLYCATFRGKTKAAEILLDRGARFDEKAFLAAAEYGHQTLIGRMLAKGVDVNAQNKDGTALQFVIQNKDVKTANALLNSSDIDVEARGGKHGQTALYVALERNVEEIATRLIQLGASINAEGGAEYKPLNAAISGKNKKLIKLLLNSGADVRGHCGEWHESALNAAARTGMMDIVEELLDRGADINEFSGNPDSLGRTPLQVACERGNFETAKLLFSRGANFSSPPGRSVSELAETLKSRWHMRKEDMTNLAHFLLDKGAVLSCPLSGAGCNGYHEQSTPLDVALWEEDQEMVDLFIKRGAQVCPSSLRIAIWRGNHNSVRKYLQKLADASTIGMALCEAISNDQHSIIESLLEVCVDVNAGCGRSYGYGCPLGYAINKSNRKLAERLLRLGANPNSLYGQFGTVLRNAVWSGETDIVRLLISNGADVNLGDDKFGCPISAAASQNRDTMIKILLEAGADPSGGDGSPLALACRGGKIHIVQMLLDAGVDPFVQEQIPGLALQKAAEWGHLDICKLLISKGVDINAYGGENGNALRAALSNQHTASGGSTNSTITYLLSNGADVNAAPSGKYISTLAAAVSNGHGDFIEKLIDGGADVNAHSNELGTALIDCARCAASKRTLQLLDAGADPLLLGGRLGSALHAAAHRADVDVVIRLIDRHGVSPGLVAGRYGPVVQAACKPAGSVQYMSVLRALVERGADVNAKGGKYHTALQCAAKHGLLDACKFLIENGADVSSEGGKFGNAIRAAKEKKHWHVSNFLERYQRKKHAGVVVAGKEPLGLDVAFAKYAIS